MQQLSLFSEKSEPTPKKTKSVWKLFVDGAARNNPGPAGAGIYLEHDGKKILGEGYFLGNKTNNQAEYMALLLGICRARAHMDLEDTLCIISDSQLLIRQVSGHYKVKNTELRILHRRIHEALHGITYITQHVLREHNSKADAFANEGIDKRHAVPAELMHLCQLSDAV